MSNYWLLYNPKTMKFYPYGGNVKHDGSSKDYIDKAVEYINKLEQENKRLKEQLKLVQVRNVNSDQLSGFIKSVMEKE